MYSRLWKEERYGQEEETGGGIPLLSDAGKPCAVCSAGGKMGDSSMDGVLIIFIFIIILRSVTVTKAVVI